MKGYLLRCVGRYWHLASFRCAAKFVRYWSNSGQRSAPVLNGPVANDPKQTSATGELNKMPLTKPTLTAASTDLAGRIKGGAGGVDAGQVFQRPLSKRDDRALQRPPQRGELVVHSGRDYGRHLAGNQAVAL